MKQRQRGEGGREHGEERYSDNFHGGWDGERHAQATTTEIVTVQDKNQCLISVQRVL